jgi:hypothetical protein
VNSSVPDMAWFLVFRTSLPRARAGRSLWCANDTRARERRQSRIPKWNSHAEFPWLSCRICNRDDSNRPPRSLRPIRKGRHQTRRRFQMKQTMMATAISTALLFTATLQAARADTWVFKAEQPADDQRPDAAADPADDQQHEQSVTPDVANAAGVPPGSGIARVHTIL